MRIRSASHGVAPSDRAGDRAAAFVPQVVAMLAAVTPLEPPIPRLGVMPGALELGEERLECSPALLLHVVAVLAWRPR